MKAGWAMGDRHLADRHLEALVSFIIAASLSGLVLARLGAFYAPLTLLLAGMATLLYLRRTAGKGSPGAGLRWRHVLPVLLLALLFRLLPFPYVMGGQDQGIYTNMAAHLVRTQGLTVSDPMLDRAMGTAAQSHYLVDNYDYPNQPRYLSGIYVIPTEKPQLEFQFYHLFPVWLALFGGVLGIGASVYALSFLSLVSVLFFQRLALALTGSERLGWVAGALLAANPLHAFFSKFPVTEVVALAFSLIGFVFVALYARNAPADRRRRWLWLSALAFLCLFLTRISGFMYLPFLLALAACALLLDTDRARARALNRWALAVLACYAASVAYGLLWANSYSLKIYSQSFEPLLGARWPLFLFAVLAMAAFAWLALWRMPIGSTPARWLARLAMRLQSWLGIGLLLVLLLGVIRIYRLGFTDAYVDAFASGPFPAIAGQGLASIAHASLWVAVIYLGPLLAGACLWLAQMRWQDPAQRSLLFFVCCFVAYAALLNWLVPYQPYYARYLLSELVPYTLLFVVLSLAWLKHAGARRLMGGLLLFSGVYFAALSAAQWGKIENAGAYEAVARLAAVAGDDDVILLDKTGDQGFVPAELKMPLVFTFGRQVINVGTDSITDASYLAALARDFDQVYLASATLVAPPGFVPVEALRLRVLGFGQSVYPPHALEPVTDAGINIYRLEPTAMTRPSP